MSQPPFQKPCKESYDTGVVVDMCVEMYEVPDDEATFTVTVCIWFQNEAVFTDAEGGGGYDTIHHLIDVTRPFTKLYDERAANGAALPEMTGIYELGRIFDSVAGVKIDTVDLFVYNVDDTYNIDAFIVK
jgi:hypothetical protein